MKVNFSLFLFLAFPMVAFCGDLLDPQNRFVGDISVSSILKSNGTEKPFDGVVGMYAVKSNNEYEVFFREISENQGEDYYLFTDLYKIEGTKRILVRQVKDFVVGCNLDGTAKFLDKSFTVTDLDGDGDPEFTFLYELQCTGDLTPGKMKLIMLESEDKYALRGQRISEQIYESNLSEIERVKSEWGWGKYESEEDFRSGHPLFLEFAKQRWDYFKIDLLSEG